MDGPDELSRLLNVKVAEIDDFENEFATKVESAMVQHDRSLNMKRLVKCRESIRNIEQRILESNSTARVAKLVDRLDELKREEVEILQMMNPSSPSSTTTNTLNEIFDAAIDDEVEDGKKAIDKIDEIADATTVEAPTLNYSLTTHHITDDHSNFDFATRVDEWLSVEPFKSTWGQHRDFFVGPSPEQQVSYHIPAFDVVSICDDDYRIPRCLWDELFDYQREGVDWMLRLHKAGHGGVLGDEMGLGKTIQVIAFLAALHVSGHLNQSGLILVPSTLLRQWIREANTWWPPLRVILLHSSSTAFSSTRSLKQFVDSSAKRAHVLVTSYGTAGADLRKHILPHKWSFVILDEGHKIRNPDAKVTLMCKQLQSYHRFALSGTPIQNNLTELWSLFDFVYPGLLGTLPTFKTELALPINAGGYANSSMIQVQTSYKCACTLRDLIKPYLMRRLKKHVFSATSANSSALPEKREEIVFCRITAYQRELYEAFIGSDEVEAIMDRQRNVLAGVDVLRKICNHPDLIQLYCSEQRFMSQNIEEEDQEYEDEEGAAINLDLAHRLQNYLFAGISRPRPHEERSGKIAVLSKILDLWQEQGHRALIFCQTRQMLNILEAFLQQSKPQMRFLRMDGMTPIKNRLQLVDDFNRSESPYFLFLLTTRVGGLGISLTGANRVIIYDPDWNPSTDLQARERVYRLGQTKPVSILRLITAGTIEEKIYHRQIFKQYLTQRILEDPKQTRFFRAADLYDLFSLNLDESTETGDMFAGLQEEFAKKMRAEPETTNDPVLNDLLDMVGVHSTLPTTPITEQIRPELALIEKEAQRVAEAALKALKQQRQPATQPSTSKRPRTEADHYNTFKPTWTGKFGEQGSFGSSTIPQSAIEGPSAKDILEAIERRKQSSSTGLNEEPSLQLALGIVDYFNRVRGAIDSDQLAHSFRAQVPDSESAVLFRTLLKQVANLNRSTRKWRLKEEFIQLKE